MNCREVKRLLPLWIGRDLADASEAEALRAHLMECRDCSLQQLRFQESLDALQSISTITLSIESHEGRPSLWPRLAMVLREVPRRRDQFNGWIPATAMALAASLMIAVSVVQIRRDMGEPIGAGRNLFLTDSRFAPGASNGDLRIPGLVVQPVEQPDQPPPNF
jgi:hypothetical protein